MNALILSAGYGKRLRPYTLNKPKCLINVRGNPIISLWVKKLLKINIKRIYINTHYKHYKVNSFLKKNFNSKIKILNEKKLLGTAGTLIKNKKFFLKSDLLFAHGDNYFMESLNKIVSFHRNRPKKFHMTMMTFKTKKPESCGIVKVKENSIIEYYEKKKKFNGNLANGAVYIISPEMLNLITKNFKNAKDFSNDVIPFIKEYIYVFQTNKIFEDIGDIQSLNRVNNF